MYYPLTVVRGAAAGSRPGSTCGSQRRKHLTTVGSQNAVLPTDCREQSTRGAERFPTHCCRRHEWEGGNFRAVNWVSSCSGHLHSIRKRTALSHSKNVASHTPYHVWPTRPVLSGLLCIFSLGLLLARHINTSPCKITPGPFCFSSPH